METSCSRGASQAAGDREKAHTHTHTLHMSLLGPRTVPTGLSCQLYVHTTQAPNAKLAMEEPSGGKGEGTGNRMLPQADLKGKDTWH